MQGKDAAFKGDMIEVCENRMLYNYSSKLGYYNEHNNNDGKICNNSIKKIIKQQILMILQEVGIILLYHIFMAHMLL